VFNMIVPPAQVLLMLWLILREHSWADLLAMPAPDPPFEGHHLNFIIAIGVNMAAGLSPWPYTGNLARLTKGARTAVWPNLFGIFAGVGVGVIALGFIAFANVTAVVGLRQVGADGIRGIGWGRLLFAFCVIPLALVTFYPQMHDGFFIFLAWTSALNPALAGIGIADDFFLRRQRPDLRPARGAAGRVVPVHRRVILSGKRGLSVTNHFESGGFIRSDASPKWPDLQFHFLPAAMCACAAPIRTNSPRSCSTISRARRTARSWPNPPLTAFAASRSRRAPRCRPTTRSTPGSARRWQAPITPAAPAGWARLRALASPDAAARRCDRSARAAPVNSWAG
jgi:hypothetical protein